MRLCGKKVVIAGETEERIIARLRQEGAEVETRLTGETYGDADLLLLCLAQKKEPENSPEELWTEYFDGKIKRLVLAAQQAEEEMKPGSRILLLYGVEAYVTDETGSVIRNLAHGTMRALVNVLAQAAGPKGILVNGITYASGGVADGEKYPLGYPDEEALVDAISFLCSGDATYIHGDTLRMDGGNHLFYRRYAIGK